MSSLHKLEQYIHEYENSHFSLSNSRLKSTKKTPAPSAVLRSVDSDTGHSRGPKRNTTPSNYHDLDSGTYTFRANRRLMDLASSIPPPPLEPEAYMDESENHFNTSAHYGLERHIHPSHVDYSRRSANTSSALNASQELDHFITSLKHRTVKRNHELKQLRMALLTDLELECDFQADVDVLAALHPPPTAVSEDDFQTLLLGEQASYSRHSHSDHQSELGPVVQNGDDEELDIVTDLRRSFQEKKARLRRIAQSMSHVHTSQEFSVLNSSIHSSSAFKASAVNFAHDQPSKPAMFKDIYSEFIHTRPAPSPHHRQQAAGQKDSRESPPPPPPPSLSSLPTPPPLPSSSGSAHRYADIEDSQVGIADVHAHRRVKYEAAAAHTEVLDLFALANGGGGGAAEGFDVDSYFAQTLTPPKETGGSNVPKTPTINPMFS